MHTPPANDPPALAGTWRIESFELVDPVTGAGRAVFGERPGGYLVLTGEGLLISVVTATEPAVAGMRPFLAYAGRYRVEGDRFVTAVEVAWDRSWIGTEQVRRFRLDGDRLCIETAPQLAFAPGAEAARAVVTWRRA
ncbi:MAG: lipocalin-like domain-containing protein [Geminicoccaceae bacterium]